MSAPEPKHHDPYISPDKKIPELGALPVLVGTLLGMVFGASSLYLVLKVGLTVSASIPVAVISITLFKLLSRFGLRPATILENNIVQTAGSAGESIAFGVGVTMPAILILGFDLEVARVTLVAVLGGLLGILMMIPLRRALIVEQHGILKYPEGTACAEVLKAGDSAATDAESQAGAQTILLGFVIGLFYKAVMVAGKLWKDVPEKIFGAPLKTASISAEISPELLGVGYIIGPQISGVMAAGGALAYLVLIPLISFFGSAATEAIAPGTIPIAKMGPDQIRGAYILYIGAGAVAAGGIVSMARSLPTIISGFRAGLRDLLGRGNAASADRPQLRTDHDLPMKYVAIGSIVLLAGITLAPQLHMNLLGALLILLLGFLFVTVSSRLTGEIGSSSNPISGMTVATLLLTCGVFLAIGWTGKGYYVTALSVGAIVCIAASNGGTTSQDLKTGFLIGATPSAQQISILFGALASALVLGPILLVLNDTATVYVPQKMTVKDDAGVESTRENFTPTLHVDPASLSSDAREALKGPQAADDGKTYRVWQKEDTAGGPAGKYLVDDSGTPIYYVDPGINGTFKHRPDGTRVQKFDAPKATLMSYIIKGILNRQLPWGLVLLGAMIALVLELSMVPSLAFAVGVYLPISSSTPILIGGFVRWLIDRRLKQQNPKANEEELTALGDKSPGVLMASGYIAGGAIAGIIIAVVAGAFGGLQTRIEEWATKHNPFVGGAHADALSMLPFVAIAVTLYLAGRRK